METVKKNVFEILNNAFSVGFKARYENVFEQYYPAHNSTGFTERNLTCNFAEALAKDLGNDSFVWYEAPLPITPEGKYPHVDAVVFSKKLNSIFLIEAKRFGDKPSGKIKSIKKDLVRLLELDNDDIVKKKSTNREHLLKEWGWKEKDKTNQPMSEYVICLADYWGENTAKVEKLLENLRVELEIAHNCNGKVNKIGKFDDTTCLINYNIFIVFFEIQQ